MGIFSSGISMPQISVQKIGAQFMKYQVIIFSVIVLILVGMTIMQIQDLLSPEPDQTVYQAELEKARPIQFNDEAITAIRQVKDSAGPIETSLPGGRINPF